MVAIRRPLDQLPQFAAPIARDDPITDGLVDVWMPAVSTKGLISGIDASVGVSANRVMTARGLGLNIRSNGLRYSRTILDGQNIAWLVIAHRDGSGNTNCSVVKKDVSVIPVQEWDGNVRTIVWSSGGGAAAVNLSSVDNFKNRVSTFGGVFSPQEQVTFVDQQPALSLAVTGGTTVRANNLPFTIGASDNGNEVATPWTIVLVAAWQGAVLPSSAKLRQLGQNPARLFQARKLPVYARTARADTSLSGAALAVATAWGGLATSVRMAGAGVAAVIAGGALTTSITLAGAAQARASAAGALATPTSGLSGTARTEAAAAGALSTSIRLAGAGAASVTGTGTLTARIALAGAARAAASAAGALSTEAPAPQFDISKISPSRIVVFEGSGSRIVTFEGSGPRMRIAQMSLKMPTKDGEKWMVDRDPDEESWYGAEITAELRDRSTTAKSVELVLLGVVQLAEPVIQMVTIDDVPRTFVTAFLGGLDDDAPPEGWKWVARVRCANGERFDKTTHFNEVDP